MLEPWRCKRRARCGCLLACEDAAADRRTMAYLLAELETYGTLVAALRALRGPQASDMLLRAARERLAVSVTAARFDDADTAQERAELQLSELRERAAEVAARLWGAELNVISARHDAGREVVQQMAKGA